MSPQDAGQDGKANDRHQDSTQKELTFGEFKKILEYYANDRRLFPTLSYENLIEDYLLLLDYTEILSEGYFNDGSMFPNMRKASTIKNVLIKELIPSLMNAADTFRENRTDRPGTGFNSQILHAVLASRNILKILES